MMFARLMVAGLLAAAIAAPAVAQGAYEFVGSWRVDQVDGYTLPNLNTQPRAPARRTEAACIARA
jgi:hypothetical protein